MSDAFPWDEASRHLIQHRDGSFETAYTGRIRTMGIRDHPTAARSPWQNSHVERLIGSIRRESLDHLIVFGEAHLRRTFKTYASYYNEVRTHLSLNKDTPTFRRARTVGSVVALPWLGGLHHQYLSGLSCDQTQRGAIRGARAGVHIRDSRRSEPLSDQPELEQSASGVSSSWQRFIGWGRLPYQ